MALENAILRFSRGCPTVEFLDEPPGPTEAHFQLFHQKIKMTTAQQKPGGMGTFGIDWAIKFTYSWKQEGSWWEQIY